MNKLHCNMCDMVMLNSGKTFISITEFIGITIGITIDIKLAYNKEVNLCNTCIKQLLESADFTYDPKKE